MNTDTGSDHSTAVQMTFAGLAESRALAATERFVSDLTVGDCTPHGCYMSTVMNSSGELTVLEKQAAAGPILAGCPSILEAIRRVGIGHQLGRGFCVSPDGGRWRDDSTAGWSSLTELLQQTLGVSISESRWLYRQHSRDVAADAEGTNRTQDHSATTTSSNCSHIEQRLPTTTAEPSDAAHEPIADVVVQARQYLAGMPAAVQGQGGDAATYKAAVALVHGHGLTVEQSLPLMMAEYNPRCIPPWQPQELRLKLVSADKWNGGPPRGYLRRGNVRAVGQAQANAAATPSAGEQLSKIQFDPQALKRVAGPWPDRATSAFLADRSSADPALVGPAEFLFSLYAPQEKVLVFTDQKSQGQAIWPAEEVPLTGPEGVWYLPQPVDGQSHPNPRAGRNSRRSEESVAAFRYLVLESDEADAQQWLGLLVQLPLRIVAIYGSGGRSVHALVRVDYATKAEWDAFKRRLAPTLRKLVRLGADPRTWRAVTLSRLPGCLREGKNDKFGVYQPFEEPRLQRLLYLRPDADGTPIRKQPVKKHVLPELVARAWHVIDGGEDCNRNELMYLLKNYARASWACEQALEELAS